MLLMTLSLRPTDAELAILRVLWQQGPSTVRAVHDRLAHDRLAQGGSTSAYTTTLKQLQIMLDKGLVERDASRRSHVYTAAVAEDGVQTSLVSDLVDKAFGGSGARLAMRALASEQASQEEIDELRAMLDELEGER